MRLARYFLLHHGNAWLVTLEGQVMARFATRTAATEAAIIMADLMGAMHHDADVMVENEEDAALELVWSYGRNKLPKRLRQRATAASAAPAHVRLVQRGEVFAA